jgi:hypothetical protein
MAPTTQLISKAKNIYLIHVDAFVSLFILPTSILDIFFVDLMLFKINLINITKRWICVQGIEPCISAPGQFPACQNSHFKELIGTRFRQESVEKVAIKKGS